MSAITQSGFFRMRVVYSLTWAEKDASCSLESELTRQYAAVRILSYNGTAFGLITITSRILTPTFRHICMDQSPLSVNNATIKTAVYPRQSTNTMPSWCACISPTPSTAYTTWAALHVLLRIPFPRAGHRGATLLKIAPKCCNAIHSPQLSSGKK